MTHHHLSETAEATRVVSHGPDTETVYEVTHAVERRVRTARDGGWEDWQKHTFQPLAKAHALAYAENANRAEVEHTDELNAKGLDRPVYLPVAEFRTVEITTTTTTRVIREEAVSCPPTT